MCRALCTSKSLKAAILDACCGYGNSNITFKLGPCSVEDITKQALWLARFGGMVAKLDLCPGPGRTPMILNELQACERVACLALQPLQLRELVLQDCTQLVALLLSTDGAHLRHLEISVTKQVAVTQICSPLIAGALGRLIGLQSLRISAVGYLDSGNRIVLSSGTCAVLGSFTQLTCLELVGTYLPAESYQHLPTQLQSLKLTGLAASRDISHLQLLTTLTLHSPENKALVGLHRLCSLQKLSLFYVVPSPGPRQQGLHGTNTFHSLRCLESRYLEISQEFAALVASSTGLTRLTVAQSSTDLLAPGVDLDAMMQPLQQLRELSLMLPQYNARAPPAASGLLPPGLTALTYLTLFLKGMPEAARVQLYHHTQLRVLSLTLHEALSGDEVLQALAMCLPQLERLSLISMPVSSAAALEVLSTSSLPRLQCLRVTRISFTVPERDQLRVSRPGLEFAFF
jgi:hypothetical protein